MEYKDLEDKLDAVLSAQEESKSANAETKENIDNAIAEQQDEIKSIKRAMKRANVSEAVSEAKEAEALHVKALNDYVRSGCLLYTSPSPRDQRGSRMPSSA